MVKKTTTNKDMASPKRFVIGFEFQNSEIYIYIYIYIYAFANLPFPQKIKERLVNPAVYIVYCTSQMRTERNS